MKVYYPETRIFGGENSMRFVSLLKYGVRQIYWERGKLHLTIPVVILGVTAAGMAVTSTLNRLILVRLGYVDDQKGPV